jgi:hypothetical protein
MITTVQTSFAPGPAIPDNLVFRPSRLTDEQSIPLIPALFQAAMEYMQYTIQYYYKMFFSKDAKVIRRAIETVPFTSLRITLGTAKGVKRLGVLKENRELITYFLNRRSRNVHYLDGVKFNNLLDIIEWRFGTKVGLLETEKSSWLAILERLLVTPTTEELRAILNGPQYAVMEENAMPFKKLVVDVILSGYFLLLRATDRQNLLEDLRKIGVVTLLLYFGDLGLLKDISQIGNVVDAIRKQLDLSEETLHQILETKKEKIVERLGQEVYEGLRSRRVFSYDLHGKVNT